MRILTIVSFVIAVTKQIPYSLLSIMDDLFFFKMHDDVDGSPVFCLLKLRPWLIPFLKNASELYDIYICTFGTYQYAQEVRSKLVSLTSHETIKAQLISRENFENPVNPQPAPPPQHPQQNDDAGAKVNDNATQQQPPQPQAPQQRPSGIAGRKKDLRSIVDLLKADFAPGMAVLLDDRHDVWVEDDARDNLLKIHPCAYLHLSLRIRWIPIISPVDMFTLVFNRRFVLLGTLGIEHTCISRHEAERRTSAN
jgi:hypothetical protein